MKVVVDLSICDLHGLCVEAAPEVFEIGDDGALHVLIETPPDGSAREGGQGRAGVSNRRDFNRRVTCSDAAPHRHRWRLARGPACGRDAARPRLRR